MKITQLTYFLLIFALSSCMSENDRENREFEKRFSKELAIIKAEQEKLAAQRKSSKQKNLSHLTKNRFQRPNEIIRNVDAPPPLKPRHAQSKKTKHSKIPPDIFELNYDTRPYPPFKTSGIEFDTIKIPKEDAYGIKSNLSNKQYALVGNDSLQRSLDKYSKSRNSQDLEFSEILIKEQKEIIKQKRLAQIRNRTPKNKQKIANNQNDESWAKKKRALRNDPINKIIGAQIVAQNLYANRPKEEDPNAKNKKNQKTK